MYDETVLELAGIVETPQLRHRQAQVEVAQGECVIPAVPRAKAGNGPVGEVEAAPPLLDPMAFEKLSATSFEFQRTRPGGKREPRGCCDRWSGRPLGDGADPRGPVVPGSSRRHTREWVGQPRRPPPHVSPGSLIPSDHLLSLRRWLYAGPRSRTGPVRPTDGPPARPLRSLVGAPDRYHERRREYRDRDSCAMRCGLC